MLQYDNHSYKIVIVGGGGVGKSAITIQLTQNHFVTEYDPTIENAYRKQFSVDGQVVMLDILDTAGQEEYSAMRDQYYRTGHGFIIVFSVVDHNSFDAVKPFITDITRVKDKNRYPIVICANKCDLQDRIISQAQVAQLQQEVGYKVFETSAKIRQNIDETFQQIVREVNRYNDLMRKHSKPKKSSGCIVM